jgi:hypothetical protein
MLITDNRSGTITSGDIVKIDLQSCGILYITVATGYSILIRKDEVPKLLDGLAQLFKNYHEAHP